MSSSRSSVVVGLDLRSPSSPRAVSSWTNYSSNQVWSNGGNSGGDTLPRKGVGSYYDRHFNASSSLPSTNPFDNAASMDHLSREGGRDGGVGEEKGNCDIDGHYVLAYGTDRGSIHYRIYPGIQADGSVTGSDSSRSSDPSSKRVSSGQPGEMVSPLTSAPGCSTGSAGSSMVVDLSSAFHGSIVSLIRLTGRSPLRRIPVFVVLVDDHKGAGPQTSTVSSGTYASSIMTLKHGAYQKLATGTQMPRMSCCAYHPQAGFVYAAGTSVLSLPNSLSSNILNSLSSPGEDSETDPSTYYHPTVRFIATNVLPNPVRSNPSSLSLICNGSMAIAAVNHSFYAIPADASNVCVKIVSFTQSSQVHPAIVLPILTSDRSALLFVGSGRECTTCMVTHSSSLSSSSKMGASNGSGSNTGIHVSSGTGVNSLLFAAQPFPVGGQGAEPLSKSSSVAGGSGAVSGEVTSLTSPILSAVPVNCGTNTYVAVLTSDGLVQLRHPACIAVPFRTVEVGSRPNNFFYLGTLEPPTRIESSNKQRTVAPAEGRLLSVGYSGDARIIVIKGDTPQDQADRLMKLTIDAFGANGFPRADLAEVLNASYSATSYVGPEPSDKTRHLLLQYIDAMLGFGGISPGESSSSLSELKNKETTNINENNSSEDLILLSLLCLVSASLAPPSASLANRAAKTANSRVPSSSCPSGAIQNLVSQVTETLLRRATPSEQKDVSLINTSSTTPILAPYKPSKEENSMEFVEAAMWLLRSAGLQEKALQVLQERITSTANVTSGWSLMKYESYAASHLGELWASKNDEDAELVLKTPTTRQLLESNPELGLSVFTSHHPVSEKEWTSISRDGAILFECDPIYHVIDIRRVVGYLKDIKVCSSDVKANVHVEEEGLEIEYKATLLVAGSSRIDSSGLAEKQLPLVSGRDLAISCIESAIGISTGRPRFPDVNPSDELPLGLEMQQMLVSIHEELAFLLLEGLLLERGGNTPKQCVGEKFFVDDDFDETQQGKIYRAKFRRLLAWPLFQGRAERLVESMPHTFLREHALLLGKLGRHEDALRILYQDLDSLHLALEYCDSRHEREQRQTAILKRRGIVKNKKEDCVYLPLVRVALEGSVAFHHKGFVNGSNRGLDAAIQVLTLRSRVVDRAAALRLLPSSVPVFAVARPFLILAVVESESQVRRYKLAASLLRARYVELKRALTEAQIASQASLCSVPALRALDFGARDPFRISKPIIVRSASQPSAPYFPNVTLVKHYFPNYLVLQAQIANDSPDRRTLADLAFIVAESSSEDSVVPVANVQVKTLPAHSTGSAWCALEIMPSRLEETVLLTCELRFTIMAVDLATGAPLTFSGEGGGGGRIYVEELNDLEVRPKEFMF